MNPFAKCLLKLHCNHISNMVFLARVNNISKHVSFFRYSSSDQSDVKPNFNIGTIGHIDHGKTTLTAAITKYLAETGKGKYIKYEDIDKAPLERLRGITINATHIGYETSYRRYAHTDCPGHIDYIKNMITGTSQMDGAILVIAASEGAMPQTYEHIHLAKQIGLKHLIVYINKADLVDDEMLQLAEIEAQDLLTEYGFTYDDTSIISGSALRALQGDTDMGYNSIEKLLQACDKLPLPERDNLKPFYMPIDNIIPITNKGTVVVGTLLEGEMKKGSPATIMGFGNSINTKIIDIQVFNKSVDVCKAGENLGVLVRRSQGHRPLKEILQRGMILCQNDSYIMHDSFKAQIYILSKEEGGRTKPIVNKYTQNIYYSGWNTSAMFILDDQSMLLPGDTAEVTILLRKPMIIQKGVNFTIRENQITSVTGIVTEILPMTELQFPGFNTPLKRSMRIEGNAKLAIKRRIQNTLRRKLSK